MRGVICGIVVSVVLVALKLGVVAEGYSQNRGWRFWHGHSSDVTVSMFDEIIM